MPKTVEVNEASGRSSSSGESQLDRVHSVPEIYQDGTDVREDSCINEPTLQPTHDELAELQRIATLLSATISRRAPTKDIADHELGIDFDSKDPELNPKDQSFNFQRWAKTLLWELEQRGVHRPRAGFTFKDLTVVGKGKAVQLHQSVGSVLSTPVRLLSTASHHRAAEKIILNNFNGTVNNGEMLVVLGRPGSGCSTFLKVVCGEMKGMKMHPESSIHYNGVPQKTYIKQLRGDVVYNQENEKHFPNLTVGQTLRFAAGARMTGHKLFNVSKAKLTEYVADIAMGIFGLSHVRDTKVGDDYIRGVSGGERKRVSIAEMAVARSPIAAWDNSTKGLDAATALTFVQALKTSCEVWGTTHAVAIYQASQNIYDIFDKAIVLYEGRQIYFGPAQAARAYFEEMGWHCPARQTTADFLTSVTNPTERQPRAGFEAKVPRTADEFESYWQHSTMHQTCLEDISTTERNFPVGGHALEEFQAFHRSNQAGFTRGASPYRISVPMQIKLCISRAYQLMWNERTPVLTRISTQLIQALIIGSIFYGTPDTTDGFYAKGSILFIVVLVNAFMSIAEITMLFRQREIVQKHHSYAFYHPSAEALAGVLADIPIKLICLVVFNTVIYFLGGLRYDAGPFFVFFLFSFATVLTMSAIFRTIAASTKAVSQAMMIAGIMILAIAMYTGFTLRRPYMHPWFKWISYVNPIAYAFEAFLVNEVHGKDFPCTTTSLVPPYGKGNNFRCAVSGSLPGVLGVSGDAWVNTTYGYSYSHLWRNFGILMSFMVFFYTTYLVISEINSESASTGERLVFKRGYAPGQSTTDDEKHRSTPAHVPSLDSEAPSAPAEKQMRSLSQGKDIFSWKGVTLDIPVKDGQRRLLDDVSGWVKPGTLTALMGTSGAGKTTLLDTLAQRMKIGVLTGDMLVNGRPLDVSFQRRTGYVQQQDVHLETTTVREALRFSALVRQPQLTPVQEKYDWVEEVITMLDMNDFSEAMVGEPGEGLNVEQRKRLTIGVELAAKPSLLLFLDEPTSGLDSTSSWAIIALLRKLADNGQAVLSTIHQPSSMLFQQFDRLLLLVKGGKTVYFGDIGQDSRSLLDYFEAAGGRECGQAENPAEYVLDVVGSKALNKPDLDWPTRWNSSQQMKDMHAELATMQTTFKEDIIGNELATSTFALPLVSQINHVTRRTFQQYWRTPKYVMGKLMLATLSALFTGFTFFNQDNSQTGMQNSMFAIFMVTTIFTPLVNQIMPRFLAQRALYEVREKPSNAYSWIAFMFSNLVTELFYQLIAAVLVYVSWYFAVFGAGQSSLTQGLMLVFCLQFYLFVGTFAFMIVAALPDAATAANVATLLFSMMLVFNGVLQIPSALPGFWKFMWRVSPLTYLEGAWAGTGLANRPVHCASNELAVFDPPPGMTCAQYLQPYLQEGAPGQVYNPSAKSNCRYCPITNGNQFLARSEIYRSQVDRNIGLVFVYIGFNMVAAVLLYYVFRVRRVSLFGGVSKRMASLRKSRQK